MSIQSPDPFSQFRIDYSKIKKDTASSDLKSDKVVSNIDSKTQNFIMGGMMALSFLAMGALLVAKYNNEAQGLIIGEFAKTAKKEADEIFENSKKILKEVVDLYKKDTSSVPGCAISKSVVENGKTIRNIFYLGTQNVMEEFSDSGKLIRKTIFTKNDVSVRINKNGVGDVSQNLDELFGFSDGKLTSYQFGNRKMPLGSEISNKFITFKDGKILSYLVDVETNANKFKKCATGIFFKDGSPNLYAERCESTADGRTLYSKCFELINGIWKSKGSVTQ